MKKRIISILMAAVMVFTLAGCAKKDEKQVVEVNRVVANDNQTANNDELLSGKYSVLISIENYGDIAVELDADAAPITVTNFMKLVNEGHYTGLTFHRIMEGFMMQGGASIDNPAANIKGEFAMNGINNNISHERGVISMARANDPDSASDQFFICHQDSQFLDGQYAAFGHVTSGMEVVDRICEEAVVVDNNGTVPPEYQPVIKEIIDTTAK